MYFMIALRAVAPAHAMSAALEAASSRATLAVVRRQMVLSSRGTGWAPRHAAADGVFDYTHPALQPQAWTVSVSTVGGALMVSRALFIYISPRRGKRDEPAPAFTFSTAVHPGLRPGGAQQLRALGCDDDRLTIVNYGFPIASLRCSRHLVPAVRIGGP